MRPEDFASLTNIPGGMKVPVHEPHTLQAARVKLWFST